MSRRISAMLMAAPVEGVETTALETSSQSDSSGGAVLFAPGIGGTPAVSRGRHRA